MAAKLKITEIAKRTGLSISTVSRVLAGKSNTSTKTKQLVLDCARAEGILETMSSGRILFNHLVVFAPSRAFDMRADIFYYRMIQGIRTAVEPYETHLSYCALEEYDSDVPLFLKRMSEPSCEGAIIIGIDDPVIHELAADIGKPCVLLNSRDKNLRLDAVLPDHQQISEFSANYLIQQGHREIVTLICLRRFTLERRLNGIRDAYTANNILFDESRHLITTSGFGTEEAEQAIDTYLNNCPSTQYPTAILTGGDFMAMGVMNALAKRKLSVPGDISLMSIDGFNLASIHDISLTSAHVPREELGQEAINLLQRRLRQPSALPCNLLVCGRLSAGDSVKRIGNSKLKPAVSTKDHGLYKG
jgi:DNA-binding LacI/PurR family transcriptional regulator